LLELSLLISDEELFLALFVLHAWADARTKVFYSNFCEEIASVSSIDHQAKGFLNSHASTDTSSQPKTRAWQAAKQRN
jgi:hypothetical protein